MIKYIISNNKYFCILFAYYIILTSITPNIKNVHVSIVYFKVGKYKHNIILYTSGFYFYIDSRIDESN